MEKLNRIPQCLWISCFTLLFVSTSHYSKAQSVRTVDNFKKLKVYPGFDLVLEQGDEPTVRFSSENLDQNRIKTKVKGKTLQIYLDNAKYHMKKEDYPQIPHVIAYITFPALEKLIVMGDSKVLCKSPIISEKFKLKAYGDQDILIHSVETDYLKTALFGDIKLEIHDGKTERQLVKSFGDNDIDLLNMQSNVGKIRTYGDSHADLYTENVLKVTVFGDSHINYKGNPAKHKKFVLGDASVRSIP